MTVGPTVESVSYGQGDTALSVATRLAAAFTSDLNSVVAASASGGSMSATVSLISKTDGSASNYALSVSSSTDESGYFAGPTINASASGGSLTGGTDAVYSPGQLNESYTIDPWGNMLPSGSVSNPNLSFAVNNRYELPASYEDSGNLVSIGGNSYCGAGQTYTYNAEAQMSCGEGVNYTYDGDGARVKKSSGTLYWGGDAGSALTESDLSGTITSEYVFLNGKRIARQDAGGAVYYYFTDMLGSSNVVTDANGVTQNESDIWPFGVEHVILDNLTNQHYKYTGKERDTESGNDYFGARYYASSMGRWLSPDWSAKAEPVPYAKLGDPQTLNLYAYVGNNPLSRADADGHESGYQYSPDTYGMRGPDDPEYRRSVSSPEAVRTKIKAMAIMSAPFMGPALHEMGMSLLVRFAPLAAGAGAALVRARDAASGALQKLSSAASSGEVELSSGTSSRLQSAMNSVSGHMTNSDIMGAVRQSVTGVEHGGDHVQEMQNAGTSLANLSKSLQGALSNPNLSDGTRQLFTNTVNALKPAIQQIKNLQH